jgi:uncharacterized membrane protein HdeD (DUF308 family)
MDAGTGPRISAAARVIIFLGGVATLLLGLYAALLPEIEGVPGGLIVGWLLLLAGLVELAASAARLRGPARNAALAAAAITTAAGLLFVFRPYIAFMPLAWVVMIWLLLRGGIQLAGGARAAGAVRTWTLSSGIADLLLGLLLLFGLPVAALVHGLFGPTREIVASFSLVFAVSFLVTGVELLAVARARA